MTIYLSVKTSSNSRAEIVAFGPLHLHQTRLATDVHRCTNACALTVPTILRCRNPVSFSGIGTRFHPYLDKSRRSIFCCAVLEPLGPLIFTSVFALWCSDFPPQPHYVQKLQVTRCKFQAIPNSQFPIFIYLNYCIFFEIVICLYLGFLPACRQRG